MVGHEYTNTLGWFFDTFDHPHRVKLLYVAGSFIHQAAGWVRDGRVDTENRWLSVVDANGKLLIYDSERIGPA